MNRWLWNGISFLGVNNALLYKFLVPYVSQLRATEGTGDNEPSRLRKGLVFKLFTEALITLDALPFPCIFIRVHIKPVSQHTARRTSAFYLQLWRSRSSGELWLYLPIYDCKSSRKPQSILSQEVSMMTAQTSHQFSLCCGQGVPVFKRRGKLFNPGQVQTLNVCGVFCLLNFVFFGLSKSSKPAQQVTHPTGAGIFKPEWKTHYRLWLLRRHYAWCRWTRRLRSVGSHFVGWDLYF